MSDFRVLRQILKDCEIWTSSPIKFFEPIQDGLKKYNATWSRLIRFKKFSLTFSQRTELEELEGKIWNNLYNFAIKSPAEMKNIPKFGQFYALNKNKAQMLSVFNNRSCINLGENSSHLGIVDVYWSFVGGRKSYIRNKFLLSPEGKEVYNLLLEKPRNYRRIVFLLYQFFARTRKKSYYSLVFKGADRYNSMRTFLNETSQTSALRKELECKYLVASYLESLKEAKRKEKELKKLKGLHLSEHRESLGPKGRKIRRRESLQAGLIRNKTNLATRIMIMKERGFITDWLPIIKVSFPKKDTLFWKEVEKHEQEDGWTWYSDIARNNWGKGDGMKFGPRLSTAVYGKYMETKLERDPRNNKLKRKIRFVQKRTLLPKVLKLRYVK